MSKNLSVLLRIHAYGLTLRISDAEVSYGQFYDCSSHEEKKEIPKDEINGKIILPGEMGEVCACGKENSPTGTAGSLKIYTGSPSAPCAVGTYSWDVPFWSTESKSTWRKDQSDLYVYPSRLWTVGEKSAHLFPRIRIAGND